MPLMFALFERELGPRVAALDYLVALGTHTPMNDAQLSALVGRPVVNGRAGARHIFNHRWDDPATYARLGTIPARDIAEILHNNTVDADRVLVIASAWRERAVVAQAVTTTGDNLRLNTNSPLVAWARDFTPGRREERELTRATSPRYSYAAQAIDSVRAIHGPRERLAYVSALAFPRRSYLRGRHSGAAARARHALSGVLNVRSTLKESRD